MPSFDAPLVSPGGEALVFSLVATDDDPINPLSSPPHEVIITVTNINDPPTCQLAAANPPAVWPPNHSMQSIVIDGVSDSDSVYNNVAIEVTGVTQDEPVNGSGDGNTSPDAVVQAGSPADLVLIRAERDGSGNGRVYSISFIADDGLESCTGTVNVGVPKKKKGTAVDDGQLYDSTLP